MKTVTFHGVLAGAYKGLDTAKLMLVHASEDGGVTAICGKVKADNLCDMEEPAATCQACIRKLAKAGRS